MKFDHSQLAPSGKKKAVIRVSLMEMEMLRILVKSTNKSVLREFNPFAAEALKTLSRGLNSKEVEDWMESAEKEGERSIWDSDLP